MNIFILRKIKSNFRIPYCLVIGFLVTLTPVIAFAGSFSVSPVNNSYTKEKNFTVNVNLNTEGKSINAVSGSLSFPKEVIEVVSISKSGSMVSLWVQDPQFSNSLGIVSFEGITPNPGFKGSGKIISVIMRPKSVGSGKLSFTNGSILANDGNGTNILNNLGVGEINIRQSESLSVPSENIPKIIIQENLDSLKIEELQEVNKDKYSEEFVETLAITEVPHVNEYQSVVRKNQKLLITGVTKYVNQKIVITIFDNKNNTEQVTTHADNNGHYAVEILNKRKGVYQFSVQVIHEGVISNFSDKNTFIVQTANVITIGEHAIGILIVILILGVLLFLIAILFVQAWQTLLKLKRNVFLNLGSAEDAVHKSFQVLQNEIRQHIFLLEITKEHRKLTTEESRILKSLILSVEEIEKNIFYHLKKIKKDL